MSASSAFFEKEKITEIKLETYSESITKNQNDSSKLNDDNLIENDTKESGNNNNEKENYDFLEENFEVLRAQSYTDDLSDNEFNGLL